MTKARERPRRLLRIDTSLQPDDGLGSVWKAFLQRVGRIDRVLPIALLLLLAHEEHGVNCVHPGDEDVRRGAGGMEV
jgi:hypothetical protein